MTEIYLLNIFTESGRNIRLAFRSSEAVTLAYKQVRTGEPTEVNDHFGNLFFINEKVCCVLINEPSLDLELDTELKLMGARAQQKMQKRASADPMLNSAILTPRRN